MGYMLPVGADGFRAERLRLEPGSTPRTTRSPPPNLQVGLATGDSFVGPSRQGGGISDLPVRQLLDRGGEVGVASVSERRIEGDHPHLTSKSDSPPASPLLDPPTKETVAWGRTPCHGQLRLPVPAGGDLDWARVEPEQIDLLPPTPFPLPGSKGKGAPDLPNATVSKGEGFGGSGGVRVTAGFEVLR